MNSLPRNTISTLRSLERPFAILLLGNSPSDLLPLDIRDHVLPFLLTISPDWRTLVLHGMKFYKPVNNLDELRRIVRFKMPCVAHMGIPPMVPAKYIHRLHLTRDDFTLSVILKVEGSISGCRHYFEVMALSKDSAVRIPEQQPHEIPKLLVPFICFVDNLATYGRVIEQWHECTTYMPDWPCAPADCFGKTEKLRAKQLDFALSPQAVFTEGFFELAAAEIPRP